MNALWGLIRISCIKFRPSFLLELSHPTYNELYNALSREPELFLHLRNPDFSAAYLVYCSFPRLLAKAPLLSVSVQKELVYSRPRALLFLSQPDLEVYQAALERDPSILKEIDLPQEMAEKIWYWKPQLFPLIKNPAESLQILAVKDNWRNIYLIKSPTDAVLEAAVHSSLGLDVTVTEENRKAVRNLFEEWKDIEEEYLLTPSYTFSQVELINHGYDGYPEALKEKKYQLRYSYSVAAFEKSAGLQIDSSKVAPWDGDNRKEEIRRKAICDGGRLVEMEEFPQISEIYRFCHQETLRKMDSLAYVRSREILGKRLTDQLKEVLDRSHMAMGTFSENELKDLLKGRDLYLPDGSKVCFSGGEIRSSMEKAPSSCECEM